MILIQQTHVVVSHDLGPPHLFELRGALLLVAVPKFSQNGLNLSDLILQRLLIGSNPFAVSAELEKPLARVLGFLNPIVCLLETILERTDRRKHVEIIGDIDGLQQLTHLPTICIEQIDDRPSPFRAFTPTLEELVQLQQSCDEIAARCLQLVLFDMQRCEESRDLFAVLGAALLESVQA
jgi:hypothetical protein